MKNQLSKILFIVGVAIIVQACKKESVTTLNSESRNENPQSAQLPNNQNQANYKEVDMKDLAGASTPYNYPLQPLQLMISPGLIEVEEDTTKPKIRRGVIITLGNDVSPIFTDGSTISQGTTIRYNYADAIPVYFSGQLYNIIYENRIVSVEQD